MDEVSTFAVELNAHTRAGDLAGAYRVIRNQPPATATVIAMHAGYSCISARDRKAFWTHLERQLSRAAKLQTDGYGLRELHRGEV